VGDKVTSVRGFPVRDQKEFYMKLMRAFPACPMKVERLATADGSGVSLGASASSVTEDAKMTTLEPELHYGEPLGIVPDETLEVVFVQVGLCLSSPVPLVQENTPGAKLFHVGDIVKQVNGTNVIDVNHFHTLIDEAAAKIAKLIINVDRNPYREAVVECDRLSDAAEKLVTRHHGFHYALVNVVNDGVRPFGLLFANLAHNKVIVLGVKPGSVTADVLKVCAHPCVCRWPPALLQPLDRIVAINGTPTTDEKVAKAYMEATKGSFSVVIERPATVETIAQLTDMQKEWIRRQDEQREPPPVNDFNWRPKPEDVLATDAMQSAQVCVLPAVCLYVHMFAGLLGATQRWPTEASKGHRAHRHQLVDTSPITCPVLITLFPQFLPSVHCPSPSAAAGAAPSQLHGQGNRRAHCQRRADWQGATPLWLTVQPARALNIPTFVIHILFFVAFFDSSLFFSSLTIFGQTPSTHICCINPCFVPKN
jgi:hypothetical protein